MDTVFKVGRDPVPHRGAMRRALDALSHATAGSVLAVMAVFPAGADELVKFTVTAGREIREPLTGRRGDPERGLAAAVDRSQGNCLACHAMPVAGTAQGTAGPDLKGVASRLKEPEIRLRLVNPRILDPRSAMPAFYRVDGLYGVRKELAGKPILTAGQIEDIVAFLMTLTD